MKRRLSKFLLLLFFLSFPAIGFSQDIDARSPHKIEGNAQQRKADKKKQKNQDLLQRAIVKGQKRHVKLQERETRRMMKKSRRTSKKYNEHKKDFFLKRWFRKKNH